VCGPVRHVCRLERGGADSLAPGRRERVVDTRLPCFPVGHTRNRKPGGLPQVWADHWREFPVADTGKSMKHGTLAALLRGVQPKHCISNQGRGQHLRLSLGRELSNMEQSHRRAHDVMVERRCRVSTTGRHISEAS
jgi:hypothetical protein